MFPNFIKVDKVRSMIILYNARHIQNSPTVDSTYTGDAVRIISKARFKNTEHS